MKKTGSDWLNDNLKLKMVILSIAFITMSSVPISTVYSNIRQEFNYAPGWVLDLVTVTPSLMNMLAIILSGVMIKIINLRKIIYLSLVIILVTGIVPAIYGGIYVVIASRSLVGFCCGILVPIVTIMITNNYRDTERSRLMGFRASSQALGSMSMMLLTIVLALLGWRYAFLIYLTAFIPLYIVLRYMQKNISYADDIDIDGASALVKTPVSYALIKKTAYFSVCAFFYMVGLNTLAPNLSSFIVESNIGDGTLSGVGMCFYMLGSLLSGLVYFRIAERCGRYTAFTGMFITAVGIVAITAANTLIPIMLGCALQGIGAAIFGAANILDVSEGIDNRAKPKVILIVLVCSSLGSFLSPFIADFGKYFLYNTDMMRARYIFGALTLLFFSAVTFIYSLKRRPA